MAGGRNHFRVTAFRFRLGPALLFGLCLCRPPALFPEDSVLQSYQQQFTRAALAAKADILRDAAAGGQTAAFFGPLCEFALQFALSSAEILKDDPDMIRLVGIAARGSGGAGFKGSIDTLWQVFSSYPDSLSRSEILGALGLLGKGNSQVIESLNQYLDSQNRLFRSGMNPDYGTIEACVGALAKVGDSSSFPVLFAVITAGYDGGIGGEARAALEAIPGNYRQFLLDIILKNPPEEKYAAFSAVSGGGRFSPAEQGQLAEAALEQSLAYFPGNAEENAVLSEMRYAAARTLTLLQWTRGSALAIRHFYRVQTDFQQGAAPVERFLEAIAFLGAMGTSDAALALGLQLSLLNAHTEKTGTYNEDITLAVIRALGAVGDKSAFDHLLYTGYLSYPDHIQAAAKEALNRLRW